MSLSAEEKDLHAQAESGRPLLTTNDQVLKIAFIYMERWPVGHKRNL